MSTTVVIPVFILLMAAVVGGAEVDACNTELKSCYGVGLYPKCLTLCDTEYFTCEKVGEPGILSTCPFGLVFNTDPGQPYCTLYENCTARLYDCDSGPPICTELSTQPICPTCHKEFFLCSGNTGVEAIKASCGDGEVFNPIPSHPGCIPEAECPCTHINC